MKNKTYRKIYIIFLSKTFLFSHMEPLNKFILLFVGIKKIVANIKNLADLNLCNLFVINNVLLYYLKTMLW